VIEEGYYQSKVKFAPLATRGRKGKPVLTRPTWPVKLQDASGEPVRDATFLVSVAQREEKGSDVTVNPGAGYTAGALAGSPDAGVGNHWWTSLDEMQYREHQLPRQVGQSIRPDGW
jgi:hypothetical protein